MCLCFRKGAINFGYETKAAKQEVVLADGTAACRCLWEAHTDKVEEGNRLSFAFTNLACRSSVSSLLSLSFLSSKSFLSPFIRLHVTCHC